MLSAITVEMRNIITFALILGTIIASHGQVDSIKQRELDSLYIRTIRSQLGLVLSSGDKYFEITNETERIKDKVGISTFIFMTHKELIDRSLRERKSLTVNYMTHKIISKDTVDINIRYKTLTAKRCIHFNHGLKTRKVRIGFPCGGTDGYVPTARFAYNFATKTWDKFEFTKSWNFRD